MYDVGINFRNIVSTMRGTFLLSIKHNLHITSDFITSDDMAKLTISQKLLDTCCLNKHQYHFHMYFILECASIIEDRLD